METRLGMIKIITLLFLSIFAKTTYTNNVSTLDELRHPRVSGRIVKLYSGVRPDPILCSGEGFQEDPVDCAVFYRCVKGANNKYTVFRYQCGPGTVYDPDTEICNHPKSTRRINCGGLITASVEPVNENEIDGARLEVPSPISTKQPLYTNLLQKNEALSPTTQKFWSSTVSRSPSASSDYPWANTVKEYLRATSSPVPRQLETKTGEPCTSNGFMGDSEDCQKFYRCVGNGRGGYIRYEFSCSELTIWDNEAQACNHAWAVKKRSCGSRNQDNERTNTDKDHAFTTEDNEVNSKETVQSQLQISYGSKVNQVQTQISKGNVLQNQTQINYGDRIQEKPNGKQNQTQISYGSAVSQAQTQISHGNMGSQTQLQIDHSREASQSQTQIHESNTQTSASPHDDENQNLNNEQPANGNEKSNECTESGFMGDSDDCKKFYRCVDNGRGGYIKYEFSCGEGTVWDRNAEACNHAWAVTDCKNKEPETINQDDKPTTTTRKSTTQYSTTTEKDTDDYENVGYGNQNQQPAQTSTTNQDKSTTTESSKTTQSSDSSNSYNNGSGENVCNSSGFMGDSRDCKKFYRCVDNGNGGYTRYEFSCGEGTVWDSNLEACNHEWAVEKCGKGTSDKNPSETTTTSNVIQNEDPNSASNNNDNKPAESVTSSTTSSSTSSPSSPSTSSTSSSSNDNTCSSSGFIGDKSNCKKFYRCVDDGKGGYTRYEFTCGEGTVWDQSIESCNHPSKDNICSPGDTATENTENGATTQPSATMQSTTTEDGKDDQVTTNSPANKPSNKPIKNEGCSKEGFFGDTKDCKKFYRCVDDQQGGFTKYEFTCGEGTIWDSEISSCNHAKSVKNGCSALTNEDTTQKEPINENDEFTESTTLQSSSTKQPEQQIVSSDTCESEGFFGNTNNCKKFYRCVDDGKGGYIKYDFTCGDGTVWDQQSQTCDHESNHNKCSESSGTNVSENPEPESETATESESSSDTTSTTTKRPDSGSVEQANSNDQCKSEGFYANSNDCKKFYRCVSDDKGGYTKYDFTCGEGTIWLQDIQACDHDNNMSNCSAQSADSSMSNSQNGEDVQSTTKTSSSTTQSTPIKENEETSNDCSNNSTQSNECESEGFYPNKNDCRKFYRCVDNGQGGFTKYDFTCGEGTAWDSKIQACNHVGEVKDCQTSTEENQSEQESAHENTSQSSNENSSQSTEATSTTKTSTTESSNENEQQTCNDKCEKEGYFGDSSDCQKFYRCVDNGNGGLTKYDFTCGEGTIWDQDLQTCNHPGDVQNPSCNKCNKNETSTTSESSGTTSTSSGSSTTSSDSSATSSSTTESQGSSNCSQSSTQKPQKSQVNCTKAGFYADPDDCKKFYRCVDWDNNGQRFSVYHFDCGEGTIWDPELETCNHEDSVYPPRDCSGTQNQNTDDTTTTSTTQKSTTEESATEHSTTQESTTEASTTQESTTSEETATTTTEKSTTQQTSTTEQSTTEKSTTEQSTTQQSSTTTEQTTTTEQSTTESSTTEQTSTTEQSTTESSTTEQSSTTEKSTTESSTTEQTSTTEESTTEQSSTTETSTTSEHTTTQQSTTQQDETTTTEQSTTEGSTEQSSTTEESTTQESSTSDSSTTEQSSSTTEQSSDGTTTEDNQESTTESSSSSSKDCPETHDDQYLYVCPTTFRRHPKYCNMFYQCTEDNDSHDLDIAVFKCPNNTIYDESKNQCVEEDKADKKCDGEKAERRRFKRLGVNSKEPIVVGKDRLSCPSTGHYPFENSECSPGFMKCDKTKSGKLRGYVHRCPDGYVYWTISRRCEAKSKVRDCKLSANDWMGRHEIPIERNNISA